MFGATPHAYANVVRMEQAQVLLHDGQLSISEIARRVGYEGYSSFSRAYQAHFGRALSVGEVQTTASAKAPPDIQGKKNPQVLGAANATPEAYL